MEAVLKQAQQTTKEYLEGIERTDAELDLRASEFHKKVDEILQQSKKQLRDLKASGLAILVGHEKEITKRLSEIKEKIKECEDVLRNGDMDSLMQYEVSQDKEKSDLDKEKSDLSNMPCVLPPIFTPGKIDKSFVKMFGSLTTVPTDNADASQCREGRNVNRADSPRFPQHEALQKPSLHKESEEQDTFVTPTIICLGSDRAWVERQKRLELVDSKGTVLDSIDTDFYFSDVALSANGELLLTDRTNDCVKSISPSRKVKKLFNTPWEPWGLCCLPSGNILVTFLEDGGAIIYNASGKEVQQLSKTQLKHPYNVTVNRFNNDICIINKDDIYINSPGRIVAFDSKFQQRYEYCSRQRDKFFPIDVCTDSKGNALITDFNTDKIHLIDENGHSFLRFDGIGLGTGIKAATKEKACGIDIDSKGKIWIVEWKGKVKILDY